MSDRYYFARKAELDHDKEWRGTVLRSQLSVIDSINDVAYLRAFGEAMNDKTMSPFGWYCLVRADALERRQRTGMRPEDV